MPRRTSIKTFALASLLTAAALSGCKKQITVPPEIVGEYEEYYVYDIPDEIGDFNIDSFGMLYVCAHIMDGETGEILENVLYSFDMDGKRTEIYRSENAPFLKFDIDRGTIYGAARERENWVLRRFDTEKKELSDICPLNDIVEISKVELLGDKLYILGIDRARSGDDGEFIDDHGVYIYNGERLITVDINTAEIVDSAVPYPIAFSASYGECVIYAADKGGYYFTGFENRSKKYHNIESMTGFDMYGSDSLIFTSGSGINIGMLCAGNTDVDKGISQIADGCFSTGEIFSAGGYTFTKTAITDTSPSEIFRIKNSAYIKHNNIIRFISPEYMFDTPFGCGYTVDYKALDDESFSLAVLSLDKSYDMCIIDSYDNYASNIRDKGSFYPLDEIPEVAAYLDKCFPNVKETALDKDGRIWMLPVELKLPVLAYKEENCKKAGIDLSKELTAQNFVDFCETAYNSEFKSGYDVHPYVLTRKWLVQYMQSHKDFDNAAFREFCEFTKDRVNISDAGNFPPYLSGTNAAFDLYSDRTGENFLFAYLSDSDMYGWFSGMEGIDFRAVPMPTEDCGNAAACVFITVNPASENLEATLDYIAALAEYLGKKQNTFILSDRETYSDEFQDLRDVYAAAEIGFNISEEICFDDFLKYQAGDLSLDEFIREADRKSAVYMGE